MKIKKIARLIWYANIALIALLGLIAGLLIWPRYDPTHAIAASLFIAAVILFMLRRNFLSSALIKGQYPALCWTVLKKMGLTLPTDPRPAADHLLHELQHPHYSTSQFLQDNDLNTDIKSGTANPLAIWIFIAGLVVLEVYLLQKYTVRERPFVFVLMPLIIVVQVIAWRAAKNKKPGTLQMKFDDKGLWLPDEGTIPWKKIYAWEYISGGKNTQARINIHSYDDEGNDIRSTLLLDSLNIHRIDVMLLLTHFQGRYGASTQTPAPG